MNALPAAILVPSVAFGLSLALMLLLLRMNRRWLAVDHPNARSLHDDPVPRVGGIAIILAMLASNLLIGGITWNLLLPLSILFAISVWDDWRPLSAHTRLTLHVVAAAWFVWHGVAATSVPMLLALVLGITWMTNLYNFMDGSDGLAGGMALFGFGSYGVAAFFAGDAGFCALNFSIAAATLAFLLFNWHPAKVFMGDAGSVPLGFLAAALGILGWQKGHWPLLFPVLVFSPFIVDASITLIRRLLRGEKVWHAHKTHYYQRLVQMGLGHTGTAMLEYGLMAAVSISTVVALLTDQMEIAAVTWTLFYLSALPVIDRRWANRLAK